MANPALIDELEKQFRDNPRRVFARLANEYRKAGDYMRAIEICHAHVPQQPGYISGHIVLGQALYDAGELDHAQQTFQAALSLDPENLIALRQLGDIARNRRDYREARGWYTRLLEVDPQNEEIVAQLGELALVDDGGMRQGTDEHAETHPQHEEPDVATAVALDEMPEPEPRGSIDLVADAEHARADVAESTDIDMPAVAAERLTIETNAEAVTPAWNGAGAHELEPLDLDEVIDFREAAAAASPEPMATSESSAEPQREEEEDDVAWIAAEDEQGADDAVITEDVAEIDETEVVIASDPLDAKDSLALDEDFDFTFEPEEFEAPLRPHTGESLSVIAEEDALAGVHSSQPPERSPFDTPAGSADDSDAEESVAEFEALPVEDIDAASLAAHTPEASARERVSDEMSDWVSTPEPAEASSGGEADADRSAAFDLSDAETRIEDAPLDIAWSEPSGMSPSPATPEPIDDALDDFGWQLADPAEIASPEPPAPAAEALPETAVEAQPIDAEAAEDAVSSRDAEPAAEPAEPAEPVHAALAGEAGAGEPAAVPGEAPQTVGAFVTETMAELYLKQGFRTEALEVYRKLSAQWPGDEVFRARIVELEHGSAPADAEEPSEAPALSGPTLNRPAASFFKALASVPVPTPPSVPATPVRKDDFAEWANAALAEAGEVSEADDSAAAALASGYGSEQPAERAPGKPARAAEGEMKLSDIFGGKERTAKPGTPGSMDAFFTAEGEREGAPAEEEEREDLEAFNAWLEGLKK